MRFRLSIIGQSSNKSRRTSKIGQADDENWQSVPEEASISYLDLSAANAVLRILVAVKMSKECNATLTHMNLGVLVGPSSDVCGTAAPATCAMGRQPSGSGPEQALESSLLAE